MNAKLKRAVAIIALILMLIFSVALIMYLFDKTLLNGAVDDLAIWCGGFGLLLFIVLWISHSFPSQEIKDAERERLYKEAEEMDRKEAEGKDDCACEAEESSEKDGCDDSDLNEDDSEAPKESE